MLSSFRERLSYSNVTATAALFIALGGTSYAVIHVDSRDVVDNSLRSTDLRNNSCSRQGHSGPNAART